ncbi:MAG: GAF domain-containing protein, partial [Chloroflexota bacterium]|nr:GAF domain-containing protein [Chloroflexota bacterium]
MSEQTILARYAALLKAYELQPDEKHLAAAAELSREMVQADMSLEATGRIYVEALQCLAQERPDMTLPDTLSLVLPFLQQLMTAGDLAHRKRLAASKQIVESLRQTTAEYRAIFETTGTAMMIIEEDTTISLLNTESEKLYGYSRKEIEGKRSWTEFVVPDDLERMKKYHRLRRSDPSLAPQNYEFRLIDKHGAVKDILLFIDVIPGTGKSVASLLDITQRKRTEKALQRRATQLTTAGEVGRQIASLRALDPLLDQVVALIREAFGYRYVSLFLIDPAGEELVLRAGAGYEIEPAKAVRLKIGEEGICGWVAANGEPLLVNDVSREPRYYSLNTLADTRSELALPVRLKEQIIGVLDVQSTELHAFDKEDIFILQILSDQVAVALENTRLFEAEQRRRQEAETLRETSLALTTTLERDEVIERILIQLREVVPYDSASVQLLQDEQLEVIGTYGFPDPEKILGITFDLAVEDVPNIKVMSSRAPLILKDAPASYDRFKQPRTRNIRGWLGVPLLIGDRAVGMLALDKHELGFYTEEHAQLALAFAAQAAVAIENARLFQAEQEQRELAEALAEAAAAIGSTLDPDEVLDHIL